MARMASRGAHLALRRALKAVALLVYAHYIHVRLPDWLGASSHVQNYPSKMTLFTRRFVQNREKAFVRLILTQYRHFE